MIDLKMGDCMEIIKQIPDNSIDFVLTDIPYETVSRNDNGLRNLDKGNADIGTFKLCDFLPLVYSKVRNSLCIFCGKEQFSEIYSFFASKKGTVRPIVWEKTNPSPMNGQYIYESGIELAVWFKKSGAKTFNAFCKNTVFRYPNGSSKLCPTTKNLGLFEELIKDNTNANDLVLDCCMGSGTTGVACKHLNRNFIGIELDKHYFEIAVNRIEGVK